MNRAHRPRFRGLDVLAVGVFGGLGSLVRWTAGEALPKAWEPMAVAAVNLVGAFGIGLLAEAVLRDRTPKSARRLLWYGTGFLGGLTTFSGLSGDVVRLGPGAGMGYGVFSLIAGWAALRAGRRLVAGPHGQSAAERGEGQR
ncbi:MAG: CrcB family protein [Brockia lithotrophica]|nr:CrcB family protein [Brockia lithotrophica]